MKKTLSQWLSHLETAHNNGLIDMGLERITQVKHAMQLHPTCPIIIVGGTNGKGSTCAFLSRIYHEAGYKVGTLTSPHLEHYNERIALNCQAVDDETITTAFEQIEAARGEVSLTYFEFNTLAAVTIFTQQHVDIMILEVGLGGRLDAVNIFDADCAIVTNVDLDHQHFLGDTVEQIGFEKAGIFRPHQYAVCGQNNSSLMNYAQHIDAKILLAQRDFSHTKLDNQQWLYQLNDNAYLPAHKRHALPLPALRGAYQLDNATLALTAIECLHSRLPVDIGAIKRGLLLAENIGRFQVLPGRPTTVLDVGHNPHAARALRRNLIALPFAQKRIAVFSILADKDSDGVIEIVKDQFDEWYIAPLHVPRGMDITQLQAKLNAHGIDRIEVFDNIAQACQTAVSQATENDRIVAFGSFHTVSDAMTVLH